jgi:hypothetical protein
MPDFKNALIETLLPQAPSKTQMLRTSLGITQMTGRRKVTAQHNGISPTTPAAGSKAGRIKLEMPADSDDSPKLDRDRFERAEIRDGERLIRRGRPCRDRKSAACRQP